MPEPDNSRVYLTPDELSARWDGAITVKTLAKWRCIKRGPSFSKLGGRVRYAVADVEAYEQRNRKVHS